MSAQWKFAGFVHFEDFLISKNMNVREFFAMLTQWKFCWFRTLQDFLISKNMHVQETRRQGLFP
jgi:hypothetical protein